MVEKKGSQTRYRRRRKIQEVKTVLGRRVEYSEHLLHWVFDLLGGLAFVMDWGGRWGWFWRGKSEGEEEELGGGGFFYIAAGMEV